MEIKIHTSMRTLLPELPWVLSQPVVGIDTETTGLDPYQDTLLSIQIASGDTVHVVDLRAEDFQPLFNHLHVYPGIICMQNAKFDLAFIYAKYKSLLYCNLWDTMLAERVISGGRKISSSLAEIANRRLGLKLNKDIRSEFTLPMFRLLALSEEQVKYGATDAWVLPQIRELQIKDLEESGQMNVAELENKIVPSMILAEYKGFRLDETAWQSVADEAKKNALEYRNRIVEILGKPLLFNPNSHKDILAAMRKLGIEIPVFQEKETTKEEFISRIKHPFITTLLHYREAAKQASTYGDEFLKKVHPLTGRIHTDYNQIGTETGRITSSGPSLHTIPDEEKYRSCFVAADGYSIISADFSRQELVIMAELSQDPELLKIFAEGLDQHRAAASGMYGVKYGDVTPEQRSAGKTLNFALAYGSGAWNIANNLNISLKLAEKLVSGYWRTYPELGKWQRRTGLLSFMHGFSTSILGRKRYFDKNLPKDSVLRQGSNFAIQGSAADMLKIAILKIQEYLRQIPQAGGTMINFLHDELEVEVRDQYAQEVAENIGRLMTEAGTEVVKTLKQDVDLKIAKCWQ